MALQKDIELPTGFVANYIVATPFGSNVRLQVFKNRNAKQDGKQPVAEYFYEMDIFSLDIPVGETKFNKSVRKAIYLKLNEDLTSFISGSSSGTINDSVLSIINGAVDVLE